MTTKLFMEIECLGYNDVIINITVLKLYKLQVFSKMRQWDEVAVALVAVAVLYTLLSTCGVKSPEASQVFQLLVFFRKEVGH